MVVLAPGDCFENYFSSACEDIMHVAEVRVSFAATRIFVSQLVQSTSPRTPNRERQGSAIAHTGTPKRSGSTGGTKQAQNYGRDSQKSSKLLLRCSGPWFGRSTRCARPDTTPENSVFGPGCALLHPPGAPTPHEAPAQTKQQHQ